MRFTRLDVGTTRHDYLPVWELQRQTHAGVVTGEEPDTILLVEHNSVLTAGRRTNLADRPTDGRTVIDVDRGGKITWHGPGQLVVYPILRLPEPIDVVAYVRVLEEVVIRVCHQYGIEAERVDGRSGVWVPARGPLDVDSKIAAVGVRVAKGVTMHGIAINTNPDLTAFSTFTPCGITDAGVTSIEHETGLDVSPVDIIDLVETLLTEELSRFRSRKVDAEGSEHHADAPALTTTQ